MIRFSRAANSSSLAATTLPPSAREARSGSACSRHRSVASRPAAGRGATRQVDRLARAARSGAPTPAQRAPGVRRDRVPVLQRCAASTTNSSGRERDRGRRRRPSAIRPLSRQPDQVGGALRHPPTRRRRGRCPRPRLASTPRAGRAAATRSRPRRRAKSPVSKPLQRPGCTASGRRPRSRSRRRAGRPRARRGWPSSRIGGQHLNCGRAVRDRRRPSKREVVRAGLDGHPHARRRGPRRSAAARRRADRCSTCTRQPVARAASISRRDRRTLGLGRSGGEEVVRSRRRCGESAHDRRRPRRAR